MKKDKKWLDDNCYKSKLLRIIPFKPDFGSYITVNDVEISDEIFKEEYAETLQFSEVFWSNITKCIITTVS